MANENIQELKFQVGEAWKGVYSSSTAYGLANVVQDPTGLSIYRSLKSGNVGHPLSDASWWFPIIDMSSIKAESDRIEALNQAIAQDEALRVAAEELRQQHEEARIAAETQRNEAEQARVNAEQARVNAESARATSEQQRITAEQGRVNAESARVTAEQARALAETLRANAEDARAANEQNRVAAEQQRIERAEQDHDRAESDHAALQVYFDSLGAFDISSYHATDGVLAKYADLTAALGTNGANIPDALRKGGMSVKFVLSSDNKYIQYRLMNQSFSTTESDWQGVDDEPTAGSDNLVTSGGVYGIIYDAKSFDIETGIWNTTKLIDFNFEAGKTYAFKVNSFTSESNLSHVTFTLKGEGLEDLRVLIKGDGGWNFIVGSQGTVTPNAQYTKLQIYVVYKNQPNPNTDTLNYDFYEVNPNAIDRRLTNIEDGNGLLNVNAVNEQSSAYNNATTARNAVPTANRKNGLQITYLLSEGWVTEQYIGSGISGWNTSDNWITSGPVKVEKNTSTGNTEISVGGTTQKIANAEFQFSNNEDANKFIKEIFIDFGTSGFTPADIKACRIGLIAPNIFKLIFWSASELIANFEEKQTVNNLYESSNNGISIKAIINPNATPQVPTVYNNITVYDSCADITNSPTICAFLADRENYNELQSEIENVLPADYVTKDVTSKLIPIDNQTSHVINADGSFGTDEMYLNKINVEDKFSANISVRAYINSGKQSLLYAFYSSTTTLDETTFISGSLLYNGSLVQQFTFEDVRIPNGAKTLVIAGRGGTTLVELTEKVYDLVSEKSLKQNLNYSGSKIVKYIKSDGTGDYTTIQEAINSITDASLVNQYELRLCNDEVYTDITDLWLVSSPSTHNANANPTSAIAAIITKDWIDIVGYGGRRKVAVYAPDTMDVTKQGNVQCMYLQGNTIIDSIDFEIKNGRYAIHQESGGSTSSLDYNARTILKNSNVKHLGNKTGTGYWDSCYAQANGTCSGLQLEYHNVVWSPAFYMHQNGNVDTNNSYLFENCRIDYPANGVFNGTPLGVYIGVNGSGQKPNIRFNGCDMWQMTFVIDMFDNNVANDYAHDIRSYIPNWVGCGNALMRYPQIDIAPLVLTFRTSNANHSISVVGGTAKPLIFGDGFKTYDGTPNAWGVCYGSEFIGKRGNNTVFTLGSRLGDCSVNNMTLIVKYDSTEYTLVFNENYTSMTNATILGKIDTMLSTLGVGAVTTDAMVHQLQFSYPMNDVSVLGRNYTTDGIQNGSAVKRDCTHNMGWRLCSAGELPDGVACERINPNGSGVIALFDRNYFPALYGLYGAAKPVGTMLKTGDNGIWQETTTEGEAILIAVAPDCFVRK